MEGYVVDADTIPDVLVEATYASMDRPGARTSFRTMVREVTTLRGLAPSCVFGADLSHVDRPVLLVWGTEDPIHPLAAGKRAAERLPDGRLETVPDAGHYVWLDAPNTTMDALRQFLS